MPAPQSSHVMPHPSEAAPLRAETCLYPTSSEFSVTSVAKTLPSNRYPGKKPQVKPLRSSASPAVSPVAQRPSSPHYFLHLLSCGTTAAWRAYIPTCSIALTMPVPKHRLYESCGLNPFKHTVRAHLGILQRFPLFSALLQKTNLAAFKTAQYPCIFAHPKTFKKLFLFTRDHQNSALPVAAQQRPRPTSAATQSPDP